jgi:5-methylcytosine-specific restriction endonuclease McrA
LVLNQSYEPITVCSVKKAMLLLLMMKADIVAKNEKKSIHTISKSYPYPSVIKLSTYFRIPFKQIELSRKNIIRRDSFTCQYCGAKTQDLTIDHIIPRSRGGADTWENLVAACHYCNNKKGNRTPEEAEMQLLSIPRKPHHIMFIKQYSGKVDDKWRPFLFMD